MLMTESAVHALDVLLPRESQDAGELVVTVSSLSTRGGEGLVQLGLGVRSGGGQHFCLQGRLGCLSIRRRQRCSSQLSVDLSSLGLSDRAGDLLLLDWARDQARQAKASANSRRFGVHYRVVVKPLKVGEPNGRIAFVVRLENVDRCVPSKVKSLLTFVRKFRQVGCRFLPLLEFANGFRTYRSCLEVSVYKDQRK